MLVGAEAEVADDALNATLEETHHGATIRYLLSIDGQPHVA